MREKDHAERGFRSEKARFAGKFIMAPALLKKRRNGELTLKVHLIKCALHLAKKLTNKL